MNFLHDLLEELQQSNPDLHAKFADKVASATPSAPAHPPRQAQKPPQRAFRRPTVARSITPPQNLARHAIGGIPHIAHGNQKP